MLTYSKHDSGQTQNVKTRQKVATFWLEMNILKGYREYSKVDITSKISFIILLGYSTLGTKESAEAGSARSLLLKEALILE